MSYICVSLQNELQYQDMTVLKVPGEIVTGPEGIQTTAVGKFINICIVHFFHCYYYFYNFLAASGTAFDFNKMQDHLYIVGM